MEDKLFELLEKMYADLKGDVTKLSTYSKKRPIKLILHALKTNTAKSWMPFLTATNSFMKSRKK